MEDDYYAEIQILVDGWPWNLREPKPRRAPRRFPSADRLCLRWELEARRPAPPAAPVDRTR
jgi:hypothetical protein